VPFTVSFPYFSIIYAIIVFFLLFINFILILQLKLNKIDLPWPLK